MAGLRPRNGPSMMSNGRDGIFHGILMYTYESVMNLLSFVMRGTAPDSLAVPMKLGESGGRGCGRTTLYTYLARLPSLGV